MNDDHAPHFDLQAAAKQVMLANGFEPDFPAAVSAATRATEGSSACESRRAAIFGICGNCSGPRSTMTPHAISTRSRWPSVCLMAGSGAGGNRRCGRSSCPKASPIDDHAAKETTSVYTGIRIFPMLPEDLSTGASSLLENQDRLAVVIEFVVSPDGGVNSSQVYRALFATRRSLLITRSGPGLKIKDPRRQRSQPQLLCKRNSNCRMKPRRR